MKNFTNKIIAIVLAAMTLITLSAQSVSAAYTISEGDYIINKANYTSNDGHILTGMHDKAVTGNYVVLAGTETICSEAFAYTNITSIEIPDTVKYIGSRAFANSKITEVIFKGNLKPENVSFDMFEGCNIKKITYVGSEKEWNSLRIEFNTVPEKVFEASSAQTNPDYIIMDNTDTSDNDEQEYVPTGNSDISRNISKNADGTTDGYYVVPVNNNTEEETNLFARIMDAIREIFDMLFRF